LFWLTNDDRADYERLFGVTHSRCYTEYGFKRTGCACCPYGGKSTFHELEVCKVKEPNLYKAAMYVFGESYEYTRKYYEFREQLKKKQKEEQSNND